MQRIFKQLDNNNDGKLNRAELVDAYREMVGEDAERLVDEILAKADSDNSGIIDYSEWMVATIDKNILLSDKKLK